MTREQRRRFVLLLLRLNPVQVHHGCCAGADNEANTIARVALGLETTGHPPLDNRLRVACICDEWRQPKGYVDRDHDIVDETDRLVAAPRTAEEQLRSGTWLTVRYAVRQGKPVLVINPDGSTVGR